MFPIACSFLFHDALMKNQSFIIIERFQFYKIHRINYLRYNSGGKNEENKKVAVFQRLINAFCGGYRTRTGHLQIANLTLYQMS